MLCLLAARSPSQAHYRADTEIPGESRHGAYKLTMRAAEADVRSLVRRRCGVDVAPGKMAGGFVVMKPTTKSPEEMVMTGGS
jgi:hypothetical protein